MIHKGLINISTLADKKYGECFLQAHIGTTTQIQAYISSPKIIPKQINQQVEEEKEP